MKILGITTTGLSKNDLEQNLVPSKELLEREIYCPLCNNSMSGWIEGCTLIHLICRNCEVRMTILNPEHVSEEELEKIKNMLEKTLYKIIE